MEQAKPRKSVWPEIAKIFALALIALVSFVAYVVIGYCLIIGYHLYFFDNSFLQDLWVGLVLFVFIPLALFGLYKLFLRLRTCALQILHKQQRSTEPPNYPLYQAL